MEIQFFCCQTDFALEKFWGNLSIKYCNFDHFICSRFWLMLPNWQWKFDSNGWREKSHCVEIGRVFVSPIRYTHFLTFVEKSYRDKFHAIWIPNFLCVWMILRTLTKSIWFHCRHKNLAIVDLEQRKIIGGTTVPHSRANNPDFTQVTTGNLKWLDGLSFQQNHIMITALATVESSLHIVEWKLDQIIRHS